MIRNRGYTKEVRLRPFDSTIQDMNTLTPDTHSESEFKELLNAIALRLDE
ncbi:hypothetical protein [Nostoc sp. CHAB 5715]|nr:hypothetical protein [Nostoc sp. CHAB 5715]MCC5626479.1 hypothetical protein [Nostoc sp. CHAB 5715]